ncbi:MAG: OB-fold domain-containing protein [Microgenomates group bacterium]|nr:OB-fold domain-containing protein [Microgenomates group bacterium]
MISPVKIWRRQKEIKKILGKKGKIISWTIIYVTGKDFKKTAPYPVVLVEFNQKEKAIGQLVDYEKEDLKIGRQVISILRKVREPSAEGVIAYGIKFKPL